MTKRKRASLKDKSPETLGLTQKKSRGMDLLFGGSVDKEQAGLAGGEEPTENEEPELSNLSDSAAPSVPSGTSSASQELVDELGLPVALEAPPDDLILASTLAEAAAELDNLATSPFAMPVVDSSQTIEENGNVNAALQESSDLSGLAVEDSDLSGLVVETFSAPTSQADLSGPAAGAYTPAPAVSPAPTAPPSPRHVPIQIDQTPAAVVSALVERDDDVTRQVMQYLEDDGKRTVAELNLKEGQIYLLDGNILVEATFNDNTGLWQLHEPEDRSSWLVLPNGKLLGMQFDVARDVWLLEREPDVWTTDDLSEAGPNTPKLSRLLRQVEQVAEEKHEGQLFLMRVSTGWKAMFGNPNFESEEGRRGVQRLRTFKTLYEAVHSLL